MSCTRIVPWLNYEEFETVYNWLFADRKTKVETVRRGIDRVQSWINRGEIPSSVEMTAAFIEIIIRDEQTNHLTHKELRLMYGMAVIRFVNGLVDREQKGRFAKSINTLARMLGLPPWFVDLRHASTHERLPSLEVLRRAALQAVGWLHDNYWIRNIKMTSSVGNNPEIKARLNEYKEHRKNFLKERYSSSGKKADAKPYVSCIEKLIKDVNENMMREDVIPLLLSVGGLVPTGKKKRASADNMAVSRGLVELWTPLLQGLDLGFPRFGLELVEDMISKLDTTNDFVINEQLLNPYAAFATQSNDDPTKAPSYLLTIACWLKHFVEEFKEASKEDRILSHITMDDVLEGSLRKPNYYTRSVLHSIATIDLELGKEIKPFTRYIDQMILKSIDSNGKKASTVVPPLKDLEIELSMLEQQLVNIKSNTAEPLLKKRKVSIVNEPMQLSDASGWKLYEDWKSCPIGTLPNGRDPCLDISVLSRLNN